MSSNSTAHINEHIYTFLTSISIVGTIGNLIVAFVYWTKRDKQTSTFFILFLAFIDLTVCSVLVPTTIFMEKIYFETDNRLFCKSYFLLMTTSVPMSSLLMTSIAFDRYFCICMVNRNIMTLFRARIIGVVLLIISASLGVIPALATTTAHIIQSSNLTNTSVNSSFHDIYQSTVEYIYLTSSSLSPMQQQPISSTTINNASAASSSSSSSVAPVCRIDPSASGIFGSLVMPFKFFYDFIFIACVITITILYILIYSEIYTRRKAKRDRKRELFYNSFLNTGFNLLNSNKPSSNTANPNGGARSTTKSIFYRIFFCLQNSRLTGNGYFNEIQDEPRNSMAQIIKLKPIPSKENELNTIYEKPLLDENTKLENEAANKIIEVRYEDGSSKSSEEDGVKSNAKPDNSNVQQRSSQPAIIRQSSILRRMSLSHTKTVISTKDIRTAFMLFVVSFLYIVFYLPSITATYLTLFIPNFPNNLYISYLYFSNSAINPIIYCFLNPNFRSDLLKLFFKKGFFFDKCNKRIILRSK